MTDPIAVLRWQLEMGADEAIAEIAPNRLAAPPPAQDPVPPAPPSAEMAPPSTARRDPMAPPPQPRPAAVLPGAVAAERSARALAAAAQSLPELEDALRAFDGCPLKFTATKLVFGEGSPRAEVMLVGEAPGAEEDREGRPFVGASGQFLERMLGAVGWSRADVFIANTLYWRPPGNRQPTPAEAAACLPFVQRQIELVAPKVLVLLGGASAKALLNRPDGISRLRGRWLEYESAGMKGPLPARATYHPAFLLRQPAQKREAWQDLISIRELVESLPK